MNIGKTKVVGVRSWFRAGMLVLMLCLSLFCSDVRALYSVTESGSSDVWGLYGSDVRSATGSEFGAVSASATDNDAYGLFGDDGDVEISGEFGVTGLISASAGAEHAYGVYSDSGDIETDALNGTIIATTGNWRAVGLYAETGWIDTGDIGGHITAVANGSSAFGLRTDDDNIYTGDITGTITAVAGGDRAYGLRAENDWIYTGNISGIITANADNEAYGLYAYGIETEDINGTITAIAAGSNAAGLVADGEGAELTVGDIGNDAVITAIAGTSNAFGLASDGTLTTGDINGTISATVTGGSSAYGLSAGSSLTVDGTIGSDASITATASDSSAFGFASGGTLTVTGDINGTISATATNGSYAYGMYATGDLTVGGSIGSDANITATAGVDDAYGLYSGGDITVTGAIDGEISAVANSGESSAYGLYASSDINTGAINGTISAEMTDGSYAYGMYAESDITIASIGSDAEISGTVSDSSAYGLSAGTITIGDINGTITATAGIDNAFGLSAMGITTGNINGEITASASGGDNAYGLNALGIETGDITGTISAAADNDNAYGLAALGIETGDITGTISATAGNSNAFGMSAASDITVGDISSSADISATAGLNYAYGFYSGGTINTGDINGTITATATSGSYAYGMYAASDLTVGDIGNDAVITATAEIDNAYGLYSGSSDTLTIGDINGHITATATTGSQAYGLYSVGDILVENINSPAHITAIAGDNDAAGLYSNGGSITTGVINGEISATASGEMVNSSAYGLYADSNITTGAINGTISAEMTNGSGAYGMYAGNDITVASIGSNADISALAGVDDAAGLYSSGGSIIITGAMNGEISATAGGLEPGTAYGLYADDSITTGAINGTISAEITDGSYAYGMYAGSDITVASIGSTADISALVSDSYAYGLYAGNDLDITGAMNGSISATATEGSGAYGMYAGDDMTVASIGSSADITAWVDDGIVVGLYALHDIGITGAMSGSISATTGWKRAYGLYSQDGDIIIGSIGSTAVITVNADDEFAYGLYSRDGDINTGAINGTINATSGDRAAGLYSEGGDIYTGNIGGDINSTAGYRAYGLYSEGDITTGNISGTSTIKTTVVQQTSYGLISQGDMTTGDIDGDIIAKSGVDNAVGLYSRGTLTTGAIGGTIDANAGGDYAYGILAYDSMDVTVDGGTISAVANGGTNVAAIQSGRIIVAGLSTQDANDTVQIVAGSTIIGAIDLGMNGTDRDLLLLSGDSWNSTVLDYNVYNVEDINITGGTWHVNGSVINNANGTRVYDEGILMGTGTLGNLYINDGGTLNPGNSIGTINVTTLTIASGGTYEVEVNDSDLADKTVVSGTANLDGTIRGVALERISRDNPFEVKVIDAPDDGLNDTYFATIAGNKLFLEFEDVYYYSAGDVNLRVTPLSYATHAVTDNERSIGLAFDDLVNTGEDTGDMDTILSVFDDMDPGEEAAANAAFDQIMPQDALGLPEVTRNMMNQFSESVLDHAGSVRASKQYAMMDGSRYLLASTDKSMTASPEVDKWLPYVKGLGTWGNRDGKEDIVGYDYSSYGIMGGVDKLVSEDTLLGFGIGGARSKVDYKQAGTSADIDSLMASLYGSYFKDDWHVDLTLGYSYNSYDSKRGIHFEDIDREATSDHQGNAYNIAMEFGNNFGGTSMLLEPVVGVGYTSVQQSGYTEDGADSLNLRVDSETTDGVYSKLGLRLAKEFRCEKNPDMVWVPKANVFWIHDFADGVKLNNEFIDGGSFTTQGQDPVRDAFNIGAGLNVYFTQSVRLFVDYGWQTAGSFNASTLQAGAQWAF